MSKTPILPSGEALYRMRLWGDFSQIMRLQEFPFDSHTFEVPVSAIPHGGGKVQLLPDPDGFISIWFYLIGVFQFNRGGVDFTAGKGRQNTASSAHGCSLSHRFPIGVRLYWLPYAHRWCGCGNVIIAADK